jgi:hypothetical protein
MYVFTKKGYKYVFICYLESITKVLHAYFGLDSCQYECLEFLQQKSLTYCMIVNL